MSASTNLSVVEQEVLDEYARLLGNMNLLSTKLHNLSTPTPAPQPPSTTSTFTSKTINTANKHSLSTSNTTSTTNLNPIPSSTPESTTNNPTDNKANQASLPEILDNLRSLERKMGLVFTLLKASVYSIVLQQQIWSGEEEGGAVG